MTAGRTVATAPRRVSAGRSHTATTRQSAATPATHTALSAALTSTAGVLDLQRTAGNAATTRLLVQRAGANKKAATGVAKYGTTRLTDRLRDMMHRGVLGVAGAPPTLDEEQIFMLQGVANVETGGMDNAVYTRDNMYVSLGFKQVTYGWGSLVEIIKAAPSAFAKHGIVLGSGTYRMMGETRPAVEGAPDPVALKTPPWTDQFYDAGQEDEVVSAIVAYTLKELGRMERRFASDSPGKSNPWMKDPTARAWLLETMNNRPAYAYAAAKATLARTSGKQLGRDEFLGILESEIIAAYQVRDEAYKGRHIIEKIPRHAPAAAVGAADPAIAKPEPQPAREPAKGVDLVGKAAAVLPGPVPSGSAGPALLGLIAATGLLGPALRLLAAMGYTDLNALTNIAFWAAHPELFGTKLRPGQPNLAALAAEWVRLRDGIVHDYGAAAPTTTTAKPAATPPVSEPPSGHVPAADIAAQTASAPTAKASAGADTAGAGDKYLTQDLGRYQDVAESGKSAGQTRIWLYGSSGANVCNMTSLTMGLVSMAGETEVRSKMIGLLKSQGMHVGAQVQVGGVFVPLAEALDDPRTVGRIQTIDLVTAVAIGPHGGYGTVTAAETIARVAKEAGLANADVATGKIYFTDPKVREKAAKMLADGKRVIAGTVNHYIYLLEVRSDGVVVHDPAGARVTPGLKGALFVHNGNGGRIAREFLAMDAGRQATALRRVSTNPKAAAVVNQLPDIAAMKGAEQAATLKKLAKEHSEYISTGATNFYATSEFDENQLRLRVVLSGTH